MNTGSSLIVSARRPTPVRGLVLTKGAKGKCLSFVDIQRWLRLCRDQWRLQKVDVLAGDIDEAFLRSLLEDAAELGLRLSLRTDCARPPKPLGLLKKAGLLDVFLCPVTAQDDHVDAWLRACEEDDLPVRLQLCAPFPEAARVESFLSASAVNVALFDPFVEAIACEDGEDSRRTIAEMKGLAEACVAASVEVNLLFLPFCFVRGAQWPHVVNRRQFFLDHQQYDESSYALAQRLAQRPAAAIREALRVLMSPGSVPEDVVEDALWLRDDPLLKPPGPTPESCRTCSLRRICDGETSVFKRLLPGLTVRPRSGPPYGWPMQFAASQPKHYDAVDAARRPSPTEETANEAGESGGASESIDEAALNFAAETTEAFGKSLGTLDAPCSVSLVLEGGWPELFGFSCGRHRMLLCPATAGRHELRLEVAADGSYLLRRDGVPIQPVQPPGQPCVPQKVGNRITPCVVVRGSGEEGQVKEVRVVERHEAGPAPFFSVLVVCCRYARRLEAALVNLAHQEGIGLDALEAVVAYVPGADETDAVLDAIAVAYSQMRVVRVPFPRGHERSKGFMINEAAQLVRGEWTVLLDADTLLAPNMLAQVRARADTAHFVAPDGRKMLTKEATARILMGHVRPWEQWGKLAAGPGEYRQREASGLPIGFCQCVKTECLRAVRYEEHEHFEGADAAFAVAVRERYGPEVWLEGVPALHLDHGGSQWYGTLRHM